MILDKLLEKKDLGAYIEYRTQHLSHVKNKMMEVAEDKQKQLITERFKGRILELEELTIIMKQDRIKEMSKTYCNEIYGEKQ